MPVELRTSRLLIRPLAPGDRPACLTAFTDSREFWRPWIPSVNSGDSPDAQFDKRLERSDASWADQSACRFSAFALADGAFVGDCGLNNIVRAAYQNADMGWRVCRVAEGKGYAREMIRAVLAWAFAPLGTGGDTTPGAGLHRIQANIMPQNTRSLTLARALGFREEGYAKAMLHLDGAWRDHVMFAMVAEEWKPAP